MLATVSPRSAIPHEETWNAESVFATPQAWEDAVDRITGALPAIESFQGRLHTGPRVLVEWFDLWERVHRVFGRVRTWASLAYAVDKTDPVAAGRHGRARTVGAMVATAAAFAEPELLAIGGETLAHWAAEEPRLAAYAHYFDRLSRRASHVRSTEVEELLGAVAEPFQMAAATHGILADADLTFEPARSSAGEAIQVAQGNYRTLLSHPDRTVRRTAWESYTGAHLAHRHAMANNLAAGVKQVVLLARARRYRTALEAAVAANDIPESVFHTLIAVFQRHLPVWHKYWRVRRRGLGVETLHLYDERAPLTERPPRVPFRQAVDWIAEGMAPLGDEYVTVLRRGVLEERWVDARPNLGKQSGAFSAGAVGTHPFIIMSYSDDLWALSTLAHELGHSLHSYYSWRTQPFVYARYPIFLAEVASNFNQALVRAHLLETETDRDFRIALLEEAMANFHRYFFVMPTLARFELEIHTRSERGQSLTAADLMTIMADLFDEGYGGEIALNGERALDRARLGITWATFHTHLYMNFYVYQYATGLSAAHALAAQVLEGADGAVERYLGFLRAGASAFPLEILRAAGVDMTSPEPVERTFEIFGTYVDYLESLLAYREGDEHRG
jgi:oligoendopeptidase F